MAEPRGVLEMLFRVLPATASVEPRGSACFDQLTGQDVMAALSGITRLQDLYVQALLGSVDMAEFAQAVYVEGIIDDCLFCCVTAQDFVPVFEQAWRAYSRNQVRVSGNALATYLGVSRSRVKVLMPVYDGVLKIINTLEVEVSEILFMRLRRAA